MPPQQNALLLTVGTTGAHDSWNEPSPGAGLLFDGALPAYFRTRRQRVTTSAGLSSDVIIDRLLILDAAVPFAAEVGHTVTFQADGYDGTQTGTIQAIEHRNMQGVPQHLASTRITLEPA